MSDASPYSSARLNEPPEQPDGMTLCRDGTWAHSQGGLTWRSTTNIRWRTGEDPMAAGGVAPVLEQAWRCIETGAVQWRRVPAVSQPSP